MNDDAWEERSPEVTLLLRRATEGDLGARERLAAALQDELRRIARGQLRRERTDHTLQATALVNEAWLRLAGDGFGSIGDRQQFLRFAAQAMRSVLVDHARRRNAVKRGGGERIGVLDEELAVWDRSQVALLDLDACLTRLEATDAQLARVVELRFFAGLGEQETGEVLGLTRRQVQHAWVLARAWLHRELGGFREPELG